MAAAVVCIALLLWGVLLHFDLHGRQDNVAGHSRANSSIAVAATSGSLPYPPSVVWPISSRVAYRYPSCQTIKYLTILRGQHPSWRTPPT